MSNRKKNIVNLQYLHNITNIQHLISFSHISIPLNSTQTVPYMYPNIFFNILCTGLDLYLIQIVQWRNLKRRLFKEINAPTEHTPGNALK